MDPFGVQSDQGRLPLALPMTTGVLQLLERLAVRGLRSGHSQLCKFLPVNALRPIRPFTSLKGLFAFEKHL